MKQKLFYAAAVSGLIAISACHAPAERAETAAHPAPVHGAPGGRYFSEHGSSIVESGRLLAQNSQKKAKKPAPKKKSSHLPGQYPESTERLLLEKDVEHQTPWGMRVMLNEIYARHGYIFKDADLRKHFAKEKWYRGKQRNLNKIKLTPTEVQNITFIKRYQQNAKI